MCIVWAAHAKGVDVLAMVDSRVALGRSTGFDEAIINWQQTKRSSEKG